MRLLTQLAKPSNTSISKRCNSNKNIKNVSNKQILLRNTFEVILMKLICLSEINNNNFLNRHILYLPIKENNSRKTSKSFRIIQKLSKKSEITSISSVRLIHRIIPFFKIIKIILLHFHHIYLRQNHLNTFNRLINHIINIFP